MDTLANCEDPDEMQHDAAFHLDLHCLLRFKQPSRTETLHNIEILLSKTLIRHIPIWIIKVLHALGEYR